MMLVVGKSKLKVQHRGRIEVGKLNVECDAKVTVGNLNVDMLKGRLET
jgi:hypothetical protein